MFLRDCSAPARIQSGQRSRFLSHLQVIRITALADAKRQGTPRGHGELTESEHAPVGGELRLLEGAPVTCSAKICVWYVCTCPGAGIGPGGEVAWAAA